MLQLTKKIVFQDFVSSCNCLYELQDLARRLARFYSWILKWGGSFCLKRVKTDLRFTMLQNRLSVLTILNFENKMLYLIKIDESKIEDLFFYYIKSEKSLTKPIYSA